MDDLQARLDAANRLIDSQAQIVFEYQRQIANLTTRNKLLADRVMLLEDVISAKESA